MNASAAELLGMASAVAGLVAGTLVLFGFTQEASGLLRATGAAFFILLIFMGVYRLAWELGAVLLRWLSAPLAGVPGWLVLGGFVSAAAWLVHRWVSGPPDQRDARERAAARVRERTRLHGPEERR